MVPEILPHHMLGNGISPKEWNTSISGLKSYSNETFHEQRFTSKRTKISAGISALIALDQVEEWLKNTVNNTKLLSEVLKRKPRVFPKMSKSKRNFRLSAQHCTVFAGFLGRNFRQNISTLILLFAASNETKFILIYAGTHTKKHSKSTWNSWLTFALFCHSIISEHSRVLDCIEH